MRAKRQTEAHEQPSMISYYTCNTKRYRMKEISSPNLSKLFLSPCKYIYIPMYMGHAVAQLIEALRYKPEGRGFDSQWCNWNFSLT
jgi:hypothetical protein